MSFNIKKSLITEMLGEKNNTIYFLSFSGLLAKVLIR